MQIFISFSSKDINILNPFVNNILKLGLNFTPENINCTGIENSKPKNGEDFKKWIKTKLSVSDVILILISKDYKSSEVCMNEMGAAWALDKKVIPFLIEPINFKNVGFIHNTSQLLRINDTKDLFSLSDDLMSESKEHISNSNLNLQIEEFKKSIINRNNNTENEKSNDFSFFKKFLIPDIDHKKILIQAQPTLSDCKKVFKQQYAEKIYESYHKQYKSLLQFENSVNDLSEYDSFEFNSASFKDLIKKIITSREV
ncbi:MAG: toll/interleukin-1 receptor domain-containing protein [Psychroflexus sp.]